MEQEGLLPLLDIPETGNPTPENHNRIRWEKAMRITDAQVHIWEHPKSGYPWEALFPLERLEKVMSEAQVDRVVLVPTRHGFTDDALAANEYSFVAAKAQPHRFAVMALIDPQRPDAPAMLADMMKRPGMKGLRLHLAWERYDAMDWIWPEAVRLGMPVALFAGRGSFEKLLPILERNPELSVLLDHAAVPAEGPDPFAEQDKVLGLAKYRNVVIKASALTRYSKEAYPFRDIHEHIHLRNHYDTGNDRCICLYWNFCAFINCFI